MAAPFTLTLPKGAALLRLSESGGGDRVGFRLRFRESCFVWRARLGRIRKRVIEPPSRPAPVVVIGHHPCFLAQPDEPDEYFNLPRSKRLSLIEQFKACGVRAYLSGHRHIPLSHTHNQIKFVTAASTARNFDGSPPGFNLWGVDEDGALDYEAILL